MGPLLLLEVSDGERWGERLPVDGLVVGEEPAHLPHCATTQVVPCTTLKLTIFAAINGAVIGESILMPQLVKRWMAESRQLFNQDSSCYSIWTKMAAFVPNKITAFTSFQDDSCLLITWILFKSRWSVGLETRWRLFREYLSAIKTVCSCRHSFSRTKVCSPVQYVL